MDDEPVDPLDIPPPEFWLTPENVERAMKESADDLAPGRGVPVEDVLERIRERQEARLKARDAALSAAE